ncbi:transcription factor tau55-related protein [Colletotrichum truncatum]|uniref:Transcription factor tau55-related protein n=1 Tax=Colletotrichum truncatum TaxID=5467 RepID=A0ACC3ZDY6_COLTU|nr:transcription factor tau55-related protein [Colletotrichum truncatum]KAF6794885.1 transcription factor tau55-related protein [Colletotrichum truncatum]
MATNNAPTSSVAPVMAATAPADKLPRAPSQVDDGDDSEWEYEYSTTETETYYLTVDLSIPQLLRRRRNAPVSGRGGYHYKHWAGPHKKPDEPKHHRILSDDENDDEPAPEPEDEGDLDQNQMDPNGEKNADNADAESESDPAADIQILDLHSDKPMFAYKGKVFEGQWARNLGTEVIFAEHNDEDLLPTLRHLPGGVDMLAASWSRINTTEKRLQPKHETAAKDDPLGEIRKQFGIHIPITADKTGERKRQTRFLENLMAIKKKRGETDEVTVYAHAAPRHINEGTSGRRKKRKPLPEGPPRKRRGRGGAASGGRGGPSAMEIGFDKKSIGAAAQSDAAGGAGPGGAEDGALSTPTPAAWTDLQGQADGAANQDAGANEYEDGSDKDSEDYEEAEE